MPKYWVKNYFAHGSFPEVGQKQKTERKKEEEERLNDGDNNDIVFPYIVQSAALVCNG